MKHDRMTFTSGERGEHVRRLQRALRRAGEPHLALDGTYAAPTHLALLRFQRARGLPADGVVTAATRLALPVGEAMPVLYQGRSGAVVDAFQRVLDEVAGPVPIDGAFGTATWMALTSFQAARGLPVNGVVTEATWCAPLDRSDRPPSLELAVGLCFAGEEHAPGQLRMGATTGARPCLTNEAHHRE